MCERRSRTRLIVRQFAVFLRRIVWCCIGRVPTHWAIALCIWCQTHSVGMASPPPEALLRGIQNVRNAYTSVSIQMQISKRGDRFDARSYGCMVELRGSNRRFEIDSLNGAPQVIIQRGNDCMSFRRTRHADAILYDLDYGYERGDIAFDPRLLGMAEILTCRLRVEQCLWYDDFVTLRTEGLEDVDDVMAWKVVASRNAEETSTYWVEEPSFRLRKRVIAGPYGVTTITSRFDGVPDGSPFPSLIEARFESPHGHGKVTTIEVSQFDLEAEIPDDRFTLASMDLPLNTAISDYRISRVVGFWDGAGISPTRVHDADERPVPEKSEEKQQYTFIVIGVNVLVLLGIIVWSYLRRRAGA